MRVRITHPTLEQIKAKVSYDPETGVFTWVSPRKKSLAGTECGAVGKLGYRIIKLYSSVYRAHVLAWFYVNGEWPSGEIDHRDRNRLNNRISNLRVCSRSQNMQNFAKRSDNRVGFKGVSRHSKTKKWMARIQVNNTKLHLGLFNTKEEAAAAYDRAALQHHGEFAVTNF